RAREGQDGRALHPRRPRHEPAADPRARRGPLRAAAAEDPFAALVRVSGRRRLGARRADHGPRAAGEPRRRADVGEAHVLLERQGGARARLRVARPGRDMSLQQILALVADRCGRPRPKIRLPHWFVYPVAVGSELVARITDREPRVSLDGVRMSAKHMYFSSAKAERELGYAWRDPAE